MIAAAALSMSPLRHPAAPLAGGALFAQAAVRRRSRSSVRPRARPSRPVRAASVCRERIGGGGEAAGRTVVIIRGADQQQVGTEAGDFPVDGGPVRPVGVVGDGGQRRRAAGQRVAARNANAFESEVEGQYELVTFTRGRRAG